MSINRCQYWNIYEPYPCIYWDNSKHECIYTEILDQENLEVYEQTKEQILAGLDVELIYPTPTTAPPYAPYCNFIGTSLLCPNYKSPSPGKYLPRCILPDFNRHVCNRATGNKWVSTKINTEVEPGTGNVSSTIEIDFSPINGYNDGACDGYGTNTTCSGYSPYHLGFGVLQPSSEENKYDTFKENRLSTVEEFGYRLPTNFVIYNIRAVLSKCFWWKAPATKFIINNDGKVELDGNWVCTCPTDTSSYSEFTLENGPPCNGCKPECKNYTGVCWRYCVDDKMETGDPILAEQIHELRYYHRENMWKLEDIEEYFIDEGTIFSWKGSRVAEFSGVASLKGELALTIGQNNTVSEYQIPTIITEMNYFDKFEVNFREDVLTQGTNLTKELKDYPTLIRELQQLPLSPIIKNRFSAPGRWEKFKNKEIINPVYFDTASLKEVVPVLIYGKTFYNKPLKAINLSDKEVASILPVELMEFDNIYDIERYLGSASGRFEKFSEQLKNSLSAIEICMPGKITINTLPSEDLTFVVESQALSRELIYNNTSENVIMVWQEVDDYITFSKVKFIKHVVGGILSQTLFELMGDYKPTSNPWDYEYSHMVRANHNGTIMFDFVPFIFGDLISEPLYVFNDSILSDPLTLDTFTGFKKYKLCASDFILEDDNWHFIGSNGYMLLDINHQSLNSLFKKFEVDTITVKYNYEVFSSESDSGTETVVQDCEMEIVHHGADGLIGPQQLIVKPKNQADLSAACDITVVLENLTFWEKRSYGDYPEVEDFTITNEYDVEGGDIKSTLDIGDVSFSENTFTLKEFGEAQTPSVVIADCEGKPFTLYRTKVISSVKQPSCPDVEIFYNWKADYTKYQNKPICTCCGPWSQINPEPSTHTWTPHCGDHFQNIWQERGPMWWPYNACLEWDTYDQITNLNNFSLDVIGLYQLKVKDADGNESWVHGSHDMRMQGPHEFYGSPGIGCNPLLPCSCEIRTYNYQKSGDNTFTGYAKIRAGVPTSQMEVWQMSQSVLPKFGNAIRPLLRTYRSLDHVPYIAPSNKDLLWKHMPASMTFNQVDITSAEDQMLGWHCSDEGPNIVNPLGFLLASEFDNINIEETIDDKNRFRHEEVFRCKYTVDVAYQHTVGEYVQHRGDDLIVPWYEFKKYPKSSGNDFIQWAWQENWKSLERNYRENYSELSNFIFKYIENADNGNIKGSFVENDGIFEGIFLLLTIEYPKYLYDYRAKELRQLLDEGDYTINFIAPKKDANTGEYIGYPAFKINNGPQRGINWDGVWLTEDNQDGKLNEGDDINESFNIELYDKCIGDKYKFRVTVDNENQEIIWSDDVTLFGEGYTDTSRQLAEDTGRMHQTYYQEDLFEKVITLKKYFQRGLAVSINDTFLNTLPLKVVPIDQLKSIGMSEESNSMTSGGESIVIGFTFDDLVKTVGRFKFSYSYGAKYVGEVVEGESTREKFNYYHKPKVTIYSSDDGHTIKNELYSNESMDLYLDNNDNYEVKELVLEWCNSWNYIKEGTKGVIIKFEASPTSNYLESLTDTELNIYNERDNFIEVSNFQLSEEYLINASEKIRIHERKYYVSYGKCGDCPPQGEFDDENLRVLGKRPGDDRSCVWQRDSDRSVVDVPNSEGTMRFMNKVRGRIVFDSYDDEEVVDKGNNIKKMESKQKEMYDLPVNEISDSEIMRGVLPLPMKKLIDSAGVTFSGPRDLILVNSVVQPLAELSSFPQMSANGHRYQPASPIKEDCGRQASHCVSGDTYKFEYKNLDYLLGDDVLVNAVLVGKGEGGTYEITSDGDIVGLTDANDFRQDTADKYGTTGDYIYGNPFDTIITNPITQLYSGAAWQIERAMMYEALLDYAFPLLFDRAPSTSIFNEDTSSLFFYYLSPISYGGVLSTTYTPSKGYSRQPDNITWTDIFRYIGSLL